MFPSPPTLSWAGFGKTMLRWKIILGKRTAKIMGYSAASSQWDKQAVALELSPAGAGGPESGREAQMGC